MKPQAQRPLAILIALLISVIRLASIDIEPPGNSIGSAFEYLFITNASGLTMAPELSISLFFSSTIVFLFVYSLVMLFFTFRGAQEIQPEK